MRLAIACVLALQCGGCVAEPPPTTLEVSDVRPHEVDVGDRLEIDGAGFPVRRTAKVGFRGTLHRGGVPAESVNVTFDIEARSEGRLDLPVTEALASRFFADGPTGHATFRGEVTVSFPASEPGAAPLRGRATNVVVDVRGSRKGTLDKKALPRDSVDALGLTIAEEAPASGGLTVAAVRAGSPAAGAGILPRDVIIELDGVRVSSLADLVPAGDATATIAIRREGHEPRVLLVPLDGALRRTPRGMVAGAGLVGAASLLLVLAMRKPSAASASVERRIAARVRELSPASIASSARDASRTLFAMLAGESTLRLSFAAALFTVVCALFSVVAPLLLPDLDVVTLTCAAMAASFASGPVGLFAMARAHAAGALALSCAIVTSGAFRLADLLRAQGAFPWEWLAFRTPATLISVMLWIVAAASLRNDSLAKEKKNAARYVTAGLIATLFLGGFRVPGVRTIEHEAWSLAAIGAALLVVKAWVAVVAIDVVRVLLPIVRASALRVRLAALLALVSPLVAHALATLPFATSRAVAIATFGGAAVVLTFAGMRIHTALSRIGVGHLDPHV